MSALGQLDCAHCLKEARNNQDDSAEQPTSVLEANRQEEHIQGGVCLDDGEERRETPHSVPLYSWVFFIFKFQKFTSSVRLIT